MTNDVEVEEEEEAAVVVATIFHLPEEFFIDTMVEEGYELTREEEGMLLNALEHIKIYFEINPTTGQVFVLGVR